MAKRPTKSNTSSAARVRDLKAQVRDLNAALTDCMQHKVDLEIERDDAHARHDRAQAKIGTLQEMVQQAENHANDLANQCNRYEEQIRKLKHTVRTLAGFAASEQSADVLPRYYRRTVSQSAALAAPYGANRDRDEAREIPGVKSQWAVSFRDNVEPL